MRNTTFLIDRRGEIVGDYSKMHLYSDMDEHVPFANGDKTEVYDTELGRLGMMICYDIRFCELARTYALKKADVLVVTSDFPNPRVNHWRTLLTARAIENQMFVVACNRVGPSLWGPTAATPSSSIPGATSSRRAAVRRRSSPAPSTTPDPGGPGPDPYVPGPAAHSLRGHAAPPRGLSLPKGACPSIFFRKKVVYES